MSTQNAIETEVKIHVPDASYSSIADLLASLGLAISESRLFEANLVYDTPGQTIRNAEMLLRLRAVGKRNILTWKGPSIPGPHKSRPELEVRFDAFDTLSQILQHLGYRVQFRYEKYRTEFSAPGYGTVTFDETPIGNYLELEGKPEWIDETASKLGFGRSDYVLESYSKLYLAHCAKEGVQPLNMVFPSMD